MKNKKPFSIRRCLLKSILTCLPSRSLKRLVTISSLLPKLSKEEIPLEKLRELNHTLELCYNVKSMDLPKSISDDIWGDTTCDLSSIKDMDSLVHLAESLYANMPVWLKGEDYSCRDLERDLLITSSMITTK